MIQLNDLSKESKELVDVATDELGSVHGGDGFGAAIGGGSGFAAAGVASGGSLRQSDPSKSSDCNGLRRSDCLTLMWNDYKLPKGKAIRRSPFLLNLNKSIANLILLFRLSKYNVRSN